MSDNENRETAQDTGPKNDGKLLLTIIKYDANEAKPMPGGKLAPTPSQLATSPLGIIRAHLLKDGFLEKDDGNKPFCTKDGVQVTDDLTFDHYAEENPKNNTPANAPAESGDPEATPTTTTKEDGKPAKHNIYILTKKRTGAAMDPTVDAFRQKPLDLSNTAKVSFGTASTGQPLTSSFNSSSWAAEADESAIHPADMTEKEWGIVMRNNNLLSGQFLQNGPVEKIIKVPGQPDIRRPGIGVTNVERSYYSAFALKPRKLPEYDITFTITDQAKDQLKELKIPCPDHYFRIPRFHIKDASQVRVFETKGSLETTMAESSFSSNSIDAAVGGSAFGISAAIKGGASWSNDDKSAKSSFNDTNYMHVVYEFPRVELILNEENLEISDECKADIQNLRDRRTVQELDYFEKRYGTFFTRSVHLGGKLVSIDESDSVAGSSLNEKTKMLKAAAGASVSGYGFQAEVNYSHTENSGSKTTSTEKKMTHSMSWSADGGNTTLCNNPPKWCPTVTSFYNWRVMKQDNVINIYEFIGKLPGYEDIPKLVENIIHLNPDPKSLVQFSLYLEPEAKPKHGRRVLAFGQPKEKEIAPLNMNPTLKDPHSLQPHGKELISDLVFKRKTDQFRPYSTAFGVPISNDQANIVLGKKEGSNVLHPRLKYGVKYPVHYLVEEKDDNEEVSTLLHSLQIGGDASSNLFLYGKHDTAHNIMVELQPIGKKKKNTPVDDYSKVKLRFSYLQDTTIPHVSNFRFKDVDDMHRPEMAELERKIIANLPQKPREPVLRRRTWEEEAIFGPDTDYVGPPGWTGLTTEEFEKDKAEYEAKSREHDDALRKYWKDLENYEQNSEKMLEKARADAEKEYNMLKKEWDEHQKVMNEYLDFETMVFHIDYCDEQNGKNIAAHIGAVKAAEAALVAEKKAQADELAKELAAGASEQMKQEHEAAVKKAHNEQVEQRKKYLTSMMNDECGYNWAIQKKKFERVARLMDTAKAAILRKDIKKKDDAITKCAEYDLDLDLAIALFWRHLNPFYKDAIAEIKVPE